MRAQREVREILPPPHTVMQKSSPGPLWKWKRGWEVAAVGGMLQLVLRRVDLI
jgi:hypothetical protein